MGQGDRRLAIWIEAKVPYFVIYALQVNQDDPKWFTGQT